MYVAAAPVVESVPAVLVAPAPVVEYIALASTASFASQAPATSCCSCRHTEFDADSNRPRGDCRSADGNNTHSMMTFLNRVDRVTSHVSAISR